MMFALKNCGMVNSVVASIRKDPDVTWEDSDDRRTRQVWVVVVMMPFWFVGLAFVCEVLRGLLGR